MIAGSWVGMIGILAIECSYLPQIARLHRLKRAEEVSLFFPGLNLFGRLFALTYSMITKDQVFTVGFFIGAMLRLTLLLQVAWYRRLEARRAASAGTKAGLVP